jgi:hypothetical protein
LKRHGRKQQKRGKPVRRPNYVLHENYPEMIARPIAQRQSGFYLTIVHKLAVPSNKVVTDPSAKITNSEAFLNLHDHQIHALHRRAAYTLLSYVSATQIPSLSHQYAGRAIVTNKASIQKSGAACELMKYFAVGELVMRLKRF